MEAIRQAVEPRPGEAEGLVDLGLSAYAAGRHDEAISQLNKAALDA
jgi:Flp pilus assembly protein TadD